MQRAVWLAVVLVIGTGCGPKAASPPPAAPRHAEVGTRSAEAVVPAPDEGPVVLQPFAWEHVRVLGNGETLGGPGLAARARPGDRVALLAADGSTIETTIDSVDLDRCEDSDALEDCARIWIAEVDDPRRQPAWSTPGGPAEDVGPIETTLAVTGAMQLPKLVPHTIEIRVFDALCEAEEDDGEFVLLQRMSSSGPNPVRTVPALDPHRGGPLRVVTVRTASRSLHFVAATAVELPRSRRMADLKGSRRESFFIIEGDGPTARVLHEESRLVGRSVLHDHMCQLPVDSPIPWTVVRVGDETFVVTRSGLQRYDRWTVAATAVDRAGTWTADVLELF